MLRERLANRKYFGRFLLSLGIAVFVSMLISSKTCKVTETWPSVNGQILKSEAIRSSGDNRATADIAYEYSVDGRYYSSEKIRAFKILAIKVAEPSALLYKFPLGKEVEVFYDPEDHSNSVLLHGPPRNFYWGFIGSIIMIVVGFVFAFGKDTKKMIKER